MNIYREMLTDYSNAVFYRSLSLLPLLVNFRESFTVCPLCWMFSRPLAVKEHRTGVSTRLVLPHVLQLLLSFQTGVSSVTGKVRVVA